MATLPPMPQDWEETRATLHAYAHAVSALPRALIKPDSRAWHVAMSVTPDGLETRPIPFPEGGETTVRMDLASHQIVLEAGDATLTWPMDAGITSTRLGDELIAAATDLGLTAVYDRGRFEDDGARPYDRAKADQFFPALEAVNNVFGEHRARLEGDVGPIHLWPHGFDLSFEWFGTRTESYEGDDVASQINLGFYPAGDAYFYSNPWPFDVDELIENPLPESCEWYVGDWQGTRLRYAALEGDPHGTERLLEFAGRVFEIASPTLTG